MYFADRGSKASRSLVLSEYQNMANYNFVALSISFLSLFVVTFVSGNAYNALNQNSTGIPQVAPRLKSVKTEGETPTSTCNVTEEGELCGTLEFLGCTGSKRFYHESAIKMNWFEAWEYCRSVGLHLAAIESRYEQTFIEIFLPKLDVVSTETYWTSGTDLGHEGSFTWMATGRSLSFTYFRSGEPNNRFGSEDCIELVIVPGGNGYVWNDRICNARGYVLCQQDQRYPEQVFTGSRSG